MNTILSLFNENILFKSMLLFILGSCIGSFLNVVIFRLPIILERKWRKESSDILDIAYTKNDQFADKFNLLTPASICLACKAYIPKWANFPILGFFFTAGKCVKCGHPYSKQYLFIELICALLFVITGYLNTDASVIFIELIFISIVVCAISIDYKTFLLPDELTMPLLWIGLLVNLHGLIAGSLMHAVLGVVTGYLVLWLIYWGFKLLTKREGIGYGDFKFLAAILAWVGLNGLVPVLFLAPGLGIVYFVIAYLCGKADIRKPIPFGPFLGIAGILVIFLGHYFPGFIPL